MNKDSNQELFTQTCEIECVHESALKKVSENLPKDCTMLQMSELFKVFGDSTRMIILCALSASELCVCDLCAVVNMSKSAVSHQLRVLRDNNLVKFRRAGKEVYYSLADDHVREILRVATEHVTE